MGVRGLVSSGVPEWLKPYVCVSSEAALKRCFKPLPGVLPVPLALQAAGHHPSVSVDRVLPPDGVNARRVDVKAWPQDALLGIAIAKEVVARLESCEWKLQVLTADHTNDSLVTRKTKSHDLLCQSGCGGSLGLFSVEIKCREVVCRMPRTFSWPKKMGEEALPLWTSELARNKAPWFARVLVFVEMPRPCHSGSFSTHSSILMNQANSDWAKLWGWQGFGIFPAAAVRSAPAAAVRSAMPVARPSGCTKWKECLKRLSGPSVSLADGDWVQLTKFLKEVGKPSGHAIRYVDGVSKPSWVKSSGAKPIKFKDWKQLPGRRGGGSPGSGGPIHCKVSFLRDVYLKYFCH